MQRAVDALRAGLPAAVNFAPNAAIVEPDGRAIGLTDPGTAASFVRSVSAIRAFFRDRLGAGDVAVLSDPDRGATHVCQLTAVTPIHRGNSVAAWAALRINMIDFGGWDVGGYSPAAVDRWAEAARFEPARLLIGGRWRREVGDLLTLNSRTPQMTRRLAHSLGMQVLELAQRAAIDVLASRYAADTSDAAKVLAALPEGETRADAAIRTPDGFASPGRIEVCVTHRSGRVQIAAVAPPPSAHPFNLTSAAATDVVLAALAATLGLGQQQSGALAALVGVELAGLLAAQLPACVGIGRETSGAALYDACARAVAQASGRPPAAAAAWVAAQTAGTLDWSSGRLTPASAARLLQTETEATR